MPFLGHHSENPNGNPQLLQQLGSLPPEVLQRIAAGGKFTPAESQQYFGMKSGAADFGNVANNENPANRAFAQDILSGNTADAQQIFSRATATHKDWNGGTAIKLAPLAAGFIPGIGPLAAAAAGAAIGAGSSAAGLNEQSPFAAGAAGAVEGAAANRVGNAARSAISQRGVTGAATAAAGTALQRAQTQLGAPGTTATGPAGSPGGSGRGGILGTGLSPLEAAQIAAAGVGTAQGAQRMGQADAYRQAALKALQPQAAPNYSSVFANPSNPYLAPATSTGLQPLNPAQRSAQRALGY